MPELIWDGKYDKDGRRVAPLCVALPFQTVETVNETAQQRQLSMDRFRGGRDPEWRSRHIGGNHKYLSPSLFQEFARKEALIQYEPDYAVVTTDGESYLVETNGREDIDVAHKDRAARIWCENATLLTGAAWTYLKIPQREFEKLQPTDFADLSVLAHQ